MGESAAELPARPLLKPWYRLAAVGGRPVLRYGASVLELAGPAAERLLPHLLPLLDGTRTVDEIVARLGEPVRPAVDRALRLLAEQRLLTEAAPAGLAPAARRTAELLAATDAYGRDPGAGAAALGRARTAVLGSGPVAAGVASLLEGAGVGEVACAGWDDRPGGVDLAVVAPGPDEVARVRGWNRHALETRTTWLQVLPFDGTLAAVGPIVVPGETACHECYALRRAANVSPLPDAGGGAYPAAPALDAVLAGLAALVALRRLALDDGLALGVLLAVEQAPAPRCTRHVVYRVPRCPACSPAAAVAAPAPWHGSADRAA